MLFKAMVLNSTMEEMVEEGKNSSITYSNDGSLITSDGLLVVLSFTINGVQHALPTMSIFTESRQSFKDLEITILKMLSAATGHKY